MRILLLPLLGIAALASASQTSRQPTLFDAAERARCEARGGQIATAGLSGDDMCALPLADAGRSCRSGSDCLGDCLLDDRGGSGKRPRVGDPAPGRCQALNYPDGCRETVEGGRLQGNFCVD